MPTLFRFLTVVALAVGAAYVAMFAVVVFVQPEQRQIVEAVALPQTAEPLQTGRSAATELDRQAALLSRRSKHH